MKDFFIGYTGADEPWRWKKPKLSEYWNRT
jgi:hypothetical protein